MNMPIRYKFIYYIIFNYNAMLSEVKDLTSKASIFYQKLAKIERNA
jgi:hypothetical protein